MEIRVNSIDDIGNAASQFLAALGDRKHIAFRAGMGAGKTTFISALCAEMGIGDEVTSPTFSIVNEYHVDNGGCAGTVYHFDFYRIETPEETLDLGLDDYFDSGRLCLMEWPENVEFFLPDDTVDVYIEVDNDGVRTIKADI